MNQDIDKILVKKSRFANLSNFAIYLTVFIDITGFGLIIPLVPFYVESFAIDPAVIGLPIGLLIASFALMQFIFNPILGKISDKIGRRPVLLLSISISCISFLIFSFAISYIMLLISRIIGGMATEISLAQAYIADVTSPKDRGTRFGRLGSVFGAGFIMGPAIASGLFAFGESIYSGFGFTLAGLGAVSLTVINLLFVYFFVPESLSSVKSNQNKLSVNKISFKSSFSNTDKKIKEYFSEFFNALKNPKFGIIFIIFLIDSIAFSAIPVIFPLLANDFYLIGAAEFGILFVYIGVIQIVWQGFFIGKLINKIGDTKLIIIGPFLMALGLITMPFINNFIYFLFSMALFSIGNGTNNTTIPSYISRRTSPMEQGKLLGTAQSWSAIGRIPGPLLGGSLYDLTLILPFVSSSGMLIFAIALAFQADKKNKKIVEKKIPIVVIEKQSNRTK
jgi:DHA1 family tetracycline resistance protein-like MFS transporter